MLLAGLFSSVSLILLISSQPTKAQTSQEFEELINGIEIFSFSLLLRSALETPDENVIVSPFSVWAMMSLLAEGAAQQTAAELRLGLNYPRNSQSMMAVRNGFREIAKVLNVTTPTIELATTNAIFADIQSPVYKRYQDTITQYYRAQVQSLNFQSPEAVRSINSFVNRATRGKITEIVNEDDTRNAQLIITNAIFFKGMWSLPFNVSQTTPAPFFDENNKQIGTVNMMFHRAPFPFVNMKSINAHIVELPYGKENRLSMIVMIPHYKVPLSTVFEQLTKIHVREVFKALKEAAELYEDDETDVYLPRFSVTSDLILNKIISELGMYQAFDPAYADFSLMSSNKDLYLSKVIHKATIEVTEEGTVATAVTAGELVNRNSPVKFVANKPFLYVIVEKKLNIVVFGGTYVAPQQF